MSHEMVGWMVVKDGETIPYSTVYFANPPLTVMEKYRARELKAAKTGHKTTERVGQRLNEATA